MVRAATQPVTQERLAEARKKNSEALGRPGALGVGSESTVLNAMVEEYQGREVFGNENKFCQASGRERSI